MLFNQNHEADEKLDLIREEWRAYLQWGFAASPLNSGLVELSEPEKEDFSTSDESGTDFRST